MATGRVATIGTTDPLAIYASVVATGGLGWNVYSWRRARTNDVQVSASWVFIGSPSGAEESIAITAVNRGDRPVRVVAAGVVSQDDQKQLLQVIAPPPGASIPGTVPPNDSGMTYLMLSILEEEHQIDLFKPVQAWVRLATNEMIVSKARRLRESAERPPKTLEPEDEIPFDRVTDDAELGARAGESGASRFTPASQAGRPTGSVPIPPRGSIPKGLARRCPLERSGQSPGVAKYRHEAESCCVTRTSRCSCTRLPAGSRAPPPTA